MSETKVTAIVPVYNVAAYIEECLDSLLAQTLQDFELILVDDHGTDDSISIAAQFIASHKKEETWHIIATPRNAGAAAARNEGIRRAKGEYILFVDADDWIEPHMIENLYKQAVYYDADISSGAAVLDYENGKHSYLFNPHVGSGLITESQRRYLLRHYVSNFTTMLFRSSWIQENGILFPISFSGEDSSFMGQCYLVCRRIAQTNEIYYHYRIHSNSVSHRKRVYRGTQKRIAFRALIKFACDKRLLSKYRWTLYWVYFKKAIITTFVDYIASR